MAMSIENSNTVPWWKEPTKDQWYAFVAAWLGWTLDAFDFTVFLLIMHPIAEAFNVPFIDVTLVFTITLWMRLVGACLLYTSTRPRDSVDGAFAWPGAYARPAGHCRKRGIERTAAGPEVWHLWAGAVHDAVPHRGRAVNIAISKRIGFSAVSYTHLCLRTDSRGRVRSPESSSSRCRGNSGHG